ncbi:Transposase, MuDR, plant [Dillenia turbinata]|uniref:Transposase, MuDR, plant n=1 Tax=Dillenia turbinata TaxID=194707 RepID=A0AAN8UTV5_9MAGN
MDWELFQAAERGEANILHQKPSLDLNLNQTTLQGNTLLHIAATSNHREFAIQVISLCPSLLLKSNSNGDTPLHIAAKTGHCELVTALLDSANQIVDIDDRTEARDIKKEMVMRVNKDNETVLDVALRHRQSGAGKLLVQLCPELLDRVREYGETESALFLAVQGNLKDVVLQILETSPACAFRGVSGMTALHAAVLNPRDEEGSFSHCFWISYWLDFVGLGHDHDHELGLRLSHEDEGDDDHGYGDENVLAMDQKPEHEGYELDLQRHNHELTLTESNELSVSEHHDLVEDIELSRTHVASRNYELTVGQEFPDVKSCRRALRDTAIALHFEMQTIKSDKTRFTAKCAREGCPWRIHAAKLPGVPTFTSKLQFRGWRPLCSNAQRRFWKRCIKFMGLHCLTNKPGGVWSGSWLLCVDLLKKGTVFFLNSVIKLSGQIQAA